MKVRKKFNLFIIQIFMQSLARKNDPNLLLERIKKFVVRVIKLVNTFPKTLAGYRIGGQLIDSASSIGANYSEAQAARSRKEFICIAGIVLKEAKETDFWLDIVNRVKLSIDKEELGFLSGEIKELGKIFGKILINSRRNQ